MTINNFVGVWCDTAVEFSQKAVECGLWKWGIQVLGASAAENGAEWTDPECKGGTQFSSFLSPSEWGPS